MYIYGLALVADKILLPRAMAQTLVAGIDTITVEVRDQYVPASFAGVLKDLQATLLQLDDAKLEHVAHIDPGLSLPRGQFFWTVFARELAGKDLLIDYNRWIRKERGYENKWYRQVENNIRNGCWLLDKSGRFAGLYTGTRRKYQRILPYLMGQPYQSFDLDMVSFGQPVQSFAAGYGVSAGEDTRIFDGPVLASIFEDLPNHYDPHIRHLTKDEQKRRVWLGVEFTSVSKEMAKQLNLRKQTQDGRIGLMINRVYPNSPAAKMALADGDVLLKLELPEAPWPIELKSDREFDFQGPDWEDIDIPEEVEAMGYSIPRKRPWPSRENLFTRMLSAIGKGTAVQVAYVHDGKESKKEFVIEQSPRDALSANKYKDEDLGITVKDLTYEVRTALKLSEDDKAVVVSKVEPGTPTALARINPFELIRAVEGQPVGSVDEFESAIKNAKQEGKESVRITVEWMGKTRLADLKLQAKRTGLNDMTRLPPGLPDTGN
jgi:hypothetical protein